LHGGRIGPQLVAEVLFFPTVPVGWTWVFVRYGTSDEDFKSHEADLPLVHGSLWQGSTGCGGESLLGICRGFLKASRKFGGNWAGFFGSSISGGSHGRTLSGREHPNPTVIAQDHLG